MKGGFENLRAVISTHIISPFSTRELQRQDSLNDDCTSSSSSDKLNSENDPLHSIDSLQKSDDLEEGKKTDGSNEDFKCLSAENSNANLMDGFIDDGLYYPEGGFQAYTIVLGSFLGLIPIFGQLNTMSVVETYIEKHQLSNNSDSNIAWVFSIFVFFMFATSIVSGFYFDFKGCKSLMIIGTLLHFVSLFLLAECTKIWHFILCFSVLSGFASGILMSPLVSCPSHYFKKKRGHAVAMATTGGSIGGIMYPLILKHFFDSNEYKWGCRTWAFIDLGLLAISTCLLKERFREEGSSMLKQIKQAIDVKGFLEMNYLFCVIGVLLSEMSVSCSLTFFGSYCTETGISSATTYSIISVINAAGIPGRWIPGYLSDRVGRFNMAIITSILLTIVSLVGWLPFGNRGSTAMFVIAAVYGFTSGSIFSLLPVCCGQISNTKDFGKRYSTMYFVVSFGTLIAIPISGAIIGDKSYHNYQNSIIYFSILCLLSAVSFYISRYYSIKTWKINVIF